MEEVKATEVPKGNQSPQKVNGTAHKSVESVPSVKIRDSDKWEVKKLGEVVKYEKTPKGNESLPYVGLEHIESHTGRFLGHLEPLSVKSNTFCFTSEHVLYGRLRPYLNKVLLPAFEGHCSTEIFPIKPSPVLDRKFLFYWLTSEPTVKKIDSTWTGARMPRANMNEVLTFNTPLPPLPEQHRIVSILDEVFAAIDQAKANVERNLQNAKELFESELNAIFSNKGEDWQEKRLGDIALTFGRGKSKHRPRNDERLYGGKYPFIQTGDVRNAETLIRGYSQTYNEVGLAQSKLWPKGTICITIAANIAETAILDFDSCFPDSIIGVIPDLDKADTKYIYYLLQYFKTELQLLGKGSAQDNINLGTFETQKFPFPPLAVQKQIVHQLDTLSAETKKLEAKYGQKLTTLEELKKSILQKAFSGELSGKEVVV